MLLKKLLKLLSTFILMVFYLFVIWIVIYIALDKLSSALTSNDIRFASVDAVYNMFLLSIVVGFFISEVIVGLNLWVWYKRIRGYKWIFVLQIVMVPIWFYVIKKSESVIPFVKNWNTSIF